jgi:putative nucleotidyltransferase with HDIG domain
MGYGSGQKRRGDRLLSEPAPGQQHAPGSLSRLRLSRTRGDHGSGATTPLVGVEFASRFVAIVRPQRSMPRPSRAAARVAVRDVTTLATTLARVRPFPAVVESVRKAAADPSAGIRDVVRFLEGDVGVATDLLRVANAPTSALTQRCTSVRHAAALLGLQRVVELVASAAALAYVESSAGGVPELAHRTLAVAGLARTLAPITGISPDAAFTAGLLHDIGMVLLVQSEDPFYLGLIDSPGFGDEPSIEEERALMGFDHAALGAAVVRAWNLPSPLPEVIGLHHDWDGALQAGGTVAVMVALVRAGDALVPFLEEFSSPSLDDLNGLLQEPAFAHLGLTRVEVHGMWEPLRRACTKASLVSEPSATEVVVGTQTAPRIESRPAMLQVRPQIVPEPAHARSSWGAMAAAVLLVMGALGLVFLLVR